MFKLFGVILFMLAILYLLLLIPSKALDEPQLANKQPFVWNQDSVWEALEREFIEAKEIDCLERQLEISKITLWSVKEISRQTHVFCLFPRHFLRRSCVET